MEPGIDGTPTWAYDEDSYCVCCGNGRWKRHMPDCVLRDALDLYDAAQRAIQQLVDGAVDEI